MLPKKRADMESAPTVRLDEYRADIESAPTERGAKMTQKHICRGALYMLPKKRADIESAPTVFWGISAR